MNRCRITTEFFDLLRDGIKTGKPKNRKVRLFLEKWQPKLKRGSLWYDGKEIIPYEKTGEIMKLEAQSNGMPLSRDGAFKYLQKRFIGFKKRRVMDFLKSVEQLQMLRKRPHKNTRVNRHTREGVASGLMRNSKGGKWNLGIDFFENPKEWVKYAYTFVAVLQRTGYMWLVPTKRKSAGAALTALKRVVQDAKKQMGIKVTGITHDAGGEFVNKKFEKYCADNGIQAEVVQLCWWVEKKNSTWARTYGALRAIHGHRKALALTLEKVNNTVNRVTGRAPADVTADTKLRRKRRNLKKQPKLRKQPVYDVGDRCRVLLKYAQGKAAFYKSYEGLRSEHHGIWSKRVFRIAQKKKRGYEYMYLVDSKWRPASDLQLITGTIVVLEGKTSKPPKKGKQKRPKSSKPRKPVAARSTSRLSIAQSVRRQPRTRRAPVRFGFP